MSKIVLKKLVLFGAIFMLLAKVSYAQNDPFSGGTGGAFAAAELANRTCIASFGGGISNSNTAVNTTQLNCVTTSFSGGIGSSNTAVNTTQLNCVTTSFSGGTAYGAVSITLLKQLNVLGNDTAVFVICANNTFNLLSLFDTVGLGLISAQWNTASPAAALPGNYRLLATTSSGCKDTANVSVAQSVVKWIGGISTDWHTAANWSTNKVPTISDHVIIPGGTNFSCVISSEDASAASVQGRTAASLTVIDNRKLLIAARCGTLPSGN